MIAQNVPGVFSSDVISGMDAQCHDAEEAIKSMDANVQPGCIVWVRVPGFPHWPAYVLHPGQVPLKYCPKPGQVVVAYLDDNRLGKHALDDLLPWGTDPDLEAKYTSGMRLKGTKWVPPSKSLKASLIRALELANMDVVERTETLDGVRYMWHQERFRGAVRALSEEVRVKAAEAEADAKLQRSVERVLRGMVRRVVRCCCSFQAIMRCDVCRQEHAVLT